MSNALEIKSLGKEYRINKSEKFWALKALNLDLKEGEVLGLIGANGAGKSTLLKILSRITIPSEGTVKAYGKLASLLEVGTGFHPDLSGRENIYLNGSILGMSRQAISKRFEAIVDFAGVRKFLDMPVKRYSSGMFVRLAFSVAAHLDADILLIDEVLAVGDAEFQKKCLNRMEDIAKEQARSIIFVSHNMGAIHSLCDRVAWLDNGQLKALGKPNEIIEKYLEGLNQINENIAIHERKDREGDGRARFSQVNARNQANSKLISAGEPLSVDLQWDSSEPNAEIRIELHLFNSRGNYLSTFQKSLQAGQNSAKLTIPNLSLMPGKFFFNCHLYLDGIRADFVGRASYFEVVSDDWQQNEVAVQRQNPGVLLNHKWENFFDKG